MGSSQREDAALGRHGEAEGGAGRGKSDRASVSGGGHAGKQAERDEEGQPAIGGKEVGELDRHRRERGKERGHQSDRATGEGGTEGGDGEDGERAQDGGDGPSHEVGTVHGVPIDAGESGKRPGDRVGHPEREGAVGELAELAGGWVGRARIQATARGIEERAEVGWPVELDAIDEDDLGDEELVGVQIGAIVPIDAVESQRQSRQEDDREGHGPDVECR